MKYIWSHGKTKHLKTEIQEMNNALSAERMKNEKLKESKTEYVIKPDKKLEESNKKTIESSGHFRDNCAKTGFLAHSTDFYTDMP